jgi:hypothetical protein
MPNAMIRAGRSRTTRKPWSALTGGGGEGMPPPPTAGATILRWARDCSLWMMRIGTSRRSCTALKCRDPTLSPSNGLASAFAAATASWIARFIPTPPTGDIACAASPMHNRTGRYQRLRRFTCTDKSFTWSHSCISSVRSATLHVLLLRLCEAWVNPSKDASRRSPASARTHHSQKGGLKTLSAQIRVYSGHNIV